MTKGRLRIWQIGLVLGLVAMLFTDLLYAEQLASPTQAQSSLQRFVTGESVFIENAGQWADTSIRYALDCRGANVGFTDQGLRFQVFRRNEEAAPVADGPRSDTSASAEMHAFSMVFDGAAPVTPVGRDQAETTFNYALGALEQHRQGVPSFNEVWYEDLYPGIDLEVVGKRGAVKYNFHVASGADWRAIRMRYEDIQGLVMLPEGGLQVHVRDGWAPLTDAAPYIYQEVDGVRRPVQGDFLLVDEYVCSFQVTGKYDPTLPVVIDPEVVWSTYLGGTGLDYGYSIALDSMDNILVTGQTFERGWLSDGEDTIYGGASDVFIAKLTASGAYIWSTYLGGEGDDGFNGIVVDSMDNVIIAGGTTSPGWISGGWDTSYHGGMDGFVVKLAPDGTHIWSSYVGGTNDDWSGSIALDSADNVLLAGYSYSSAWVNGGWDSGHNGDSDGFVLKLNPNGGHLWSTFVGGPDQDSCNNITRDSSDNVLVTGDTTSSSWVSNGYDMTQGGSYDGFVLKLTSAGKHVWSTYLGGSNDDFGDGIAVDSNDNTLISGNTASAGWVNGGREISLYGYDDGFVVKLTSAGIHTWSTCLGGDNHDACYGILADSKQDVLVTGFTLSSGWTNGGWDTIYGGNLDGFVAKLSSDGAHLWSSYLGGSGDDVGRGLGMDSVGTLLVTGDTDSAGWVNGGWDNTHNGARDSFVVKIGETEGIDEGEGEMLFEGEGESHPVDEGELFEAEGEFDHEGETIVVEGELSEGEDGLSGEGCVRDKGKGLSVPEIIDRILGDWFMVGLGMVILVGFAIRMK